MSQHKKSSGRIGTLRVMVIVILSLAAAVVGLVFLFTSDKDSRSELKQRFKNILNKAKKTMPSSD